MLFFSLKRDVKAMPLALFFHISGNTLLEKRKKYTS